MRDTLHLVKHQEKFIFQNLQSFLLLEKAKLRWIHISCATKDVISDLHSFFRGWFGVGPYYVFHELVSVNVVKNHKQTLDYESSEGRRNVVVSVGILLLSNGCICVLLYDSLEH